MTGNLMICFLCSMMLPAAVVAGQLPADIDAPREKVQRIRFVEDDAQNYMVSKIYELRHQKANDLVPFILGAIKRYAANGSADRINYAAAGKQYVAVSCPAPLMPYIDDMIAKLDRPGARGPDGSGIDGTGIVRSVYKPRYRATETMMQIMIKAGIPSNATGDAGQDATLGFDPGANLIYWKDSINKDKDLKKYLAWLDRPVPQVAITLKLYEVRESELRDLGLDYLAWKNGPGLNLLDVGAKFMEGSALADAFGLYGFFMFAPAIDFSFVRLLEQNDEARLSTSARVVVATGQDARLAFAPDYQNLVKDDQFAAAVTDSANDRIELAITAPVIALSGAADKNGLIGYSQQDYRTQSGVVNFTYTLRTRTVVAGNNFGEELFDEATSASAVSIQTGQERLLNRWVREMEVEQTIGVPILCELPVLKYLFGTTTRTREKVFCFLAAEAELVHPDADISRITGTLTPVRDLVQNLQEKGK